MDSNGKQCATLGTLTLSKRYKIKQEESYMVDYGHTGTQKVSKVITEHLRNILFKPSDFEHFKLRSGDEVYGLAIRLSDSEVNVGEVVICEWYGLKAEKEIN